MSGVTRLERLYNLASIVSCAIIILSQCILAILLVLKLLCSRSKPTNGSIGSFKYYQYCAVSFFLSLCVAYTMLMLSRVTWLNDPESDAWRPFYVLYYAFAAVAIVSVYVYLIVRLYRTFLNTQHQVKQIYLQMHFGIACVGTLILSFVPIIGIVEKIEGLWYAVLVTVVVVVLTSMTHLIYLFNRRLHQQVMRESLFYLSTPSLHSRSLTSSPRVSTDVDAVFQIKTTHAVEEKADDTNDLRWSEASLDLLRISRKHSLLGFVMLMSCLMATCTSWFSIFCGADEECIGLFWCVWYPWHAINIIVCGFCIFLSFSINIFAYKLLCYCCDRKCAALCKKSAKRSISRSGLLDMSSTPPPATPSVPLCDLK